MKNYIKNIFKRAALIAGGIYEENNFSALYRTIADIKNYLGCKIEEIISVCQSLSMRILDGGNTISGNVQTPVLLNTSKITIVADNLGSTDLPVSAYELSINGRITTIYSPTYEFEGIPGRTYSVKIRAICGGNNCESISMIVKDGAKSITGDITTPVNIDNDYVTIKAESKNATDTEADYYELEINGVSRIVNIRTYQFTGNKDIVYSLRMRSVCVTKEPCPDFDTFEGYTIEAIYVHTPDLNNKFELCRLPSSSSSSTNTTTTTTTTPRPSSSSSSSSRSSSSNTTTTTTTTTTPRPSSSSRSSCFSNWPQSDSFLVASTGTVTGTVSGAIRSGGVNTLYFKSPQVDLGDFTAADFCGGLNNPGSNNIKFIMGERVTIAGTTAYNGTYRVVFADNVNAATGGRVANGGGVLECW